MPTPRPGSTASRRQEVIQQGKADATAETAKGVAGMQGAKGAALAKLVADKGKTKTKDEAKRAEVTAKIQSIFTATEADVKKILDGIDPKVEKEFNAGRGRRAGDVRDAMSRPRCRPTRRTVTAAGSAVCAGPRTSCSGCPTRSTSSTRPAASSTSSRWTRSSRGSPTSSATT